MSGTKRSDIFESCLTKHYGLNDHHPEHFFGVDGLRREEDDVAIEDMPLLSRMELTCDLLACLLGVYIREGRSDVTIADCRAIIERQRWKNWKFAVKDPLPEASEFPPDPLLRWPCGQFEESERERLEALYYELRDGGISPVREIAVLKGELLRMESVTFYLRDLSCHVKAVERVCREIPEFDRNEELWERIRKHDRDKWDLDMLIGYTLKWCFAG